MTNQRETKQKSDFYGGKSNTVVGALDVEILLYPSLETLFLNSHPPFQNTQNNNKQHNDTSFVECFEKIQHPYPANPS